MKSRLDDIDHTILEVKNTVDNATTLSSSFGQDASSIAVYLMDSAQHHHSNDGRPHAATLNDQYYGTSSIASLFGEIEALLEARLTARKNATTTEGLTIPTDGIQECHVALHNMAKTLLYNDSLDFAGEDLPPTLPPQRVLEASIELYFNQISSMLPIFRKSTLCERFRRIYSTGPNQADIAWVICFNNIILQTLSPETIQSSNQSEENHVPVGESAERELLQPLLANYRRGLKKLDRLLKPELVNVQALLLMVSSSNNIERFLVLILTQCTIAQESFHYRLASLLLNQACFVAKSMGLHHQHTIALDQTSDESMEHNHTFWALYIMDKTISLTMGQSCCLPLYDSDVVKPIHDPSNPFYEHFVARVELAAMQEDSYQMLYSSQARRRGDFGQSNSISRLDHKLALGASRHGDLREDVPNNSGTNSPSHSMHSFASTVLGYHFYMTRLLVHRAVKRTSDQRQCCSDSRACIRLLQRLNVDYAAGACAIMSRR